MKTVIILRRALFFRWFHVNSKLTEKDIINRNYLEKNLVFFLDVRPSNIHATVQIKRRLEKGSMKIIIDLVKLCKSNMIMS